MSKVMDITETSELPVGEQPRHAIAKLVIGSIAGYGAGVASRFVYDWALAKLEDRKTEDQDES